MKLKYAEKEIEFQTALSTVARFIDNNPNRKGYLNVGKEIHRIRNNAKQALRIHVFLGILKYRDYNNTIICSFISEEQFFKVHGE